MDQAEEKVRIETVDEQTQPRMKQGKRFWIGVGAGSLVLIGATVVFFVKAAPHKDRLPALTAEDLEQQKYDAEQTKEARQKAAQIRDDKFLVRKDDDSQVEFASLVKDLNLPKDQITDQPQPATSGQAKAREEAIDFVLRKPAPAATDTGRAYAPESMPGRTQQSPTSSDTATSPMFVYSRSFGGAKFVDAPKQVAQPVKDSSQTGAPSLQIPKPDQASAQPKDQRTTLIYTSLPPVTLYEGEVIEGVLVNRISADTEPSPVVCRIARDLFDDTATYVVFPANSRIVGFSQVVNYKGAHRLFISFHRIILPGGPAIDLPSSRKSLKALDQTGALGVASKVERHWFLQFGTAIFFGALDGLSGAAQRNQNLFSTTSIVLGRTSENFERILETIMAQYSTIVPTIRVDQGKRMLIFLSDDVVISPYARISDRSYYTKR